MKKPDFHSFFASRRVLMIASLLLGIIAWLVVSIVVDPNVTTTIRDIPVELELTGSTAELNGLDAMDKDSLKVSAQITGAIYTVGNLSGDDFVATVDISDVSEPGTYQLPVTVTKKDSRVSTYNVDYPTESTIAVTFDRFEEETFTLEASVSNKSVADGTFMGELVFNPASVTLNGPATKLSAISRVVLENDETMTLSKSATVSASLVYYDEAGALVDGDNITADLTDPKITMPLFERLTLPVTFDYINVPSGLDIEALNYTLSVESLSIGVPVDAAVSLESIDLGEIDVRSIDIGYTHTFEVSLLAGYLNLDDVQEITLTFTDEMESATHSSSNIVTKNIPSDYDITVNASKLSDIVFVGLPDAIASLTDEDVVVTLDFSNVRLTRGEQRVKALISLDSDAQAWAVGEYYISVTAAPKA